MSIAPNFSAARALAGTALFSPVTIGLMKLQHRVCMAPMGRLRAIEYKPDEWISTDLAAEYYGQRATEGGFQITESTPISRLVSILNFLILPMTNGSNRQRAIRESLESILINKSSRGRVSPKLFIGREATYSARYGTLVELPFLNT